MRAEIDRIEDGKFAVIYFETGAELILPVELLGFKAYEGQHLKVEFTPDTASEKESSERISDLQRRLLERTRKRDNDEKEEK